MIEAPYEMSHLFPESTGLPFVVWVSYRGNARHDIRVKVSSGPKARMEEMQSVAIRPAPHLVNGEMKPADFRKLSRWIELNRQTLIDYWEGEIDTKDLINQLKPLGKTK